MIDHFGNAQVNKQVENSTPRAHRNTCPVRGMYYGVPLGIKMENGL